MSLLAVFVRRFNVATGRYGRRHYLIHVVPTVARPDYGNESEKRLACAEARRVLGRIVRSCDYLEAEHDGGRRRYYGTGAPSPGGVGLW